MRRSWLNPVALAVLTSLLAAGGALAATESWPGFRGPEPPPSGVLPETFGLEVAWNRELGSGYSSLAISGDTLVTAFTSGEEDVIAAFDRTSGEERWRTTLAERYVGHTGSDDGPIATPRIAGDDVFMLGPRGQLVALALADGSQKWTVQLDESNSTTPFYGYTSSPLVTDDLVVVATGGDGHAVTAYDRKSGAVRWAVGDDSATYQAPAAATLAGRKQIVAVTDHWAWGLDPADGTALWSFRHTEGNATNESAHPTPIDDRHVLIDLDNESLMLAVSQSGDGFTAEEAWRSRGLGGSLVLPVHHEGHLYGFTGQILTSIDAASGDINWRTRDAGGNNMTLVDGRLAVLEGSGDLVIVEADPAGYSEVARTSVFERGDYADAAFVDGHFYVRNLSHLAAIRVDADAKPQVAEEEADPLRYAGALGAKVKEWEQLPEGQRQAAVDAYFGKVESTPLIEESGLVTFVNRTAETNVAVTGLVFGWQGRTEELHRLAGTDLFYRSFELDPAGAYEYALSIDYEQPAPDPANPLTVDYPFGPQSELRMPGWRANPALADPPEDAPRGQVDTFQFYSETLESRRQVKVWMPPGYDAGADTAYPLLVVHHGDQAEQFGDFLNVLDNTVGKTVEPLVAVLLPRNSGAEYNGPQAEAYLGFLTGELLPHVERHYHVAEDPDRRAATGVGSAGVISLHAALAHPTTFGRVATQSFYLGEQNRDAFWELIASTEAKPSLVWIETGPNDYDIPQNGIDAERSSNALAEKLEARGFPVEVDVVGGAAGWAAWRGQSDRILEGLFPLEKSAG